MPSREKSREAKARILVVDDHSLVRFGLAELLAGQPDMEPCGEASTIADALRLVKVTAPDAVVIDLSLEGENGITLIKQIKTRYPKVAMLVSSMHSEARLAASVLRAGASGYVEKRKAITSILDGLRAVLRGEIYLSPGTTSQLLGSAARGKPLDDQDPSSILSARELQVFELLGQGKTIKYIAGQLQVAPGTIESHRRNIRDKLKLRNSTELILRACNWVRDRY